MNVPSIESNQQSIHIVFCSVRMRLNEYRHTKVKKKYVNKIHPFHASTDLHASVVKKKSAINTLAHGMDMWSEEFSLNWSEQKTLVTCFIFYEVNIQRFKTCYRLNGFVLCCRSSFSQPKDFFSLTWSLPLTLFLAETQNIWLRYGFRVYENGKQIAFKFVYRS